MVFVQQLNALLRKKRIYARRFLVRSILAYVLPPVLCTLVFIVFANNYLFSPADVSFNDVQYSSSASFIKGNDGALGHVRSQRQLRQDQSSSWFRSGLLRLGFLSDDTVFEHSLVLPGVSDKCRLFGVLSDDEEFLSNLETLHKKEWQIGRKTTEILAENLCPPEIVLTLSSPKKPEDAKSSGITVADLADGSVRNDEENEPLPTIVPMESTLGLLRVFRTAEEVQEIVKSGGKSQQFFAFVTALKEKPLVVESYSGHIVRSELLGHILNILTNSKSPLPKIVHSGTGNGQDVDALLSDQGDSDDLMSEATSSSTFYLLLLLCAIGFTLLPSFYFSIVSMISDRNLGLKEVLRTIGMQDSTYYLHWIIPSMANGVIFGFTLILNIVFHARKIPGFPEEIQSEFDGVKALFCLGGRNIIGLLFLLQAVSVAFHMAIIFMAFAWSAMWRTETPAAVSGCLIIFLGPVVSFLIRVNETHASQDFAHMRAGWFWLLINPSETFVQFTARIVEAMVRDVSRDMHSRTPLVNLFPGCDAKSFGGYWGLIVANCCLYFVIWYYLDQTIKHPNCSRQKPGFLCKKRHWKNVFRFSKKKVDSTHLLLTEENVKAKGGVDYHGLNGVNSAMGQQQTLKQLENANGGNLDLFGSSLFDIPGITNAFFDSVTVNSVMNISNPAVPVVESAFREGDAGDDELIREMLEKRSKMSRVSDAVEQITDHNLLRLEATKQVVEVRDLKVKYKRTRVLKGVNLLMYPGEIFCLLGHNGAGKSTTMMVLAGYIGDEDVESGEVEIFGNVNRIRELRELGAIGYCPQRVVLWEDLTVREHVDLFFQLKGIKVDYSRGDDDMVTNFIRDLGGSMGVMLGVDNSKRSRSTTAKNQEGGADLDNILLERQDTPVRYLSGGTRRLLSVGLAFIGNPRFVILDEPSAGLDPITTKVMWAFLERMKRDRVIMITTHDMPEAESISNRVGIMRQGVLECWGSSEFLKRRFDCGYNIVMELNLNYFLQSKCESHILEGAVESERQAGNAFGQMNSYSGKSYDGFKPLDDIFVADYDDGFDFLKGSRGNGWKSSLKKSTNDIVPARGFTTRKPALKTFSDVRLALQYDYFPSVFVRNDEFYDKTDSPLYPLFKIKSIFDEELRSRNGALPEYEFSLTDTVLGHKNYRDVMDYRTVLDDGASNSSGDAGGDEMSPEGNNCVINVKLSTFDIRHVSAILERLQNELGHGEGNDADEFGGIGSVVRGNRMCNKHTQAKIVSRFAVENCTLGDVFLKIALLGTAVPASIRLPQKQGEAKQSIVDLEENRATVVEQRRTQQPSQIGTRQRSVDFTENGYSDEEASDFGKPNQYLRKNYLQDAKDRVNRGAERPKISFTGDQGFGSLVGDDIQAAVLAHDEEHGDDTFGSPLLGRDCTSVNSLAFGGGAVLLDRPGKKREEEAAAKAQDDAENKVKNGFWARSKRAKHSRMPLWRCRVLNAMLEMRWLVMRRDFKNMIMSFLLPLVLLGVGCHFYRVIRAQMIDRPIRHQDFYRPGREESWLKMPSFFTGGSDDDDVTETFYSVDAFDFFPQRFRWGFINAFGPGQYKLSKLLDDVAHEDLKASVLKLEPVFENMGHIEADVWKHVINQDMNKIRVVDKQIAMVTREMELQRGAKFEVDLAAHPKYTHWATDGHYELARLNEVPIKLSGLPFLHHTDKTTQEVRLLDFNGIYTRDEKTDLYTSIKEPSLKYQNGKLLLLTTTAALEHVDDIEKLKKAEAVSEAAGKSAQVAKRAVEAAKKAAEKIGRSDSAEDSTKSESKIKVEVLFNSYRQDIPPLDDESEEDRRSNKDIPKHEPCMMFRDEGRWYLGCRSGNQYKDQVTEMEKKRDKGSGSPKGCDGVTLIKEYNKHEPELGIFQIGKEVIFIVENDDVGVEAIKWWYSGKDTAESSVGRVSDRPNLENPREELEHHHHPYLLDVQVNDESSRVEGNKVALRHAQDHAAFFSDQPDHEHDDATVKISLTFDELEVSTYNREEKNLIDAWINLRYFFMWSCGFLAAVVCIIITFLPAMTASRVERDVTQRTKLHILLTGVSQMQYWASVFIWDMFMCCLLLLSFALIFWYYDVPFLITKYVDTDTNRITRGINWLMLLASSMYFGLFVISTLFSVYFFSHVKNELWSRIKRMIMAKGIFGSSDAGKKSSATGGRHLFILFVFAFNFICGFILLGLNLHYHGKVFPAYLRTVSTVEHLHGSIYKDLIHGVKDHVLSTVVEPALKRGATDLVQGGVMNTEVGALSSLAQGSTAAGGNSLTDGHFLGVGTISTAASVARAALHAFRNGSSVRQMVRGFLDEMMGKAKENEGDEDFEDVVDWDMDRFHQVRGRINRLFWVGCVVPAYPLFMFTFKTMFRQTLLEDFGSPSASSTTVQKDFKAISSKIFEERVPANDNFPSFLMTNRFFRCTTKTGAECRFRDPASRLDKSSEVAASENVGTTEDDSDSNSNSSGSSSPSSRFLAEPTSSHHAQETAFSKSRGSGGSGFLLQLYNTLPYIREKSSELLFAKISKRDHDILKQASIEMGDLYYRFLTVGDELIQLIFAVVFYFALLRVSTLGLQTVRDVSTTSVEKQSMDIAQDSSDKNKEIEHLETLGRLKDPTMMSARTASGKRSFIERISGVLSHKQRSDGSSTPLLCEDEGEFPEADDFSDADTGDNLFDKRAAMLANQTAIKRGCVAVGAGGGAVVDDGCGAEAGGADKAGSESGKPLSMSDLNHLPPADQKYAMKRSGLVNNTVTQTPDRNKKPSVVSTSTSIRRLDSEIQADVGVVREIARVRRIENPEKQMILLRDVQKCYYNVKKTVNSSAIRNPAMAVKNICWAVEKNPATTQFYSSKSTMSGGKGIFGLLGRNGAGKTTLFKMMLRLEKPTEGEIYMLGSKNLLDYSKVGYCPQTDEPLLYSLTVFENLRFYGQLKLQENYSNIVVNALINDLELAPFANKKCGHLSIGNQRKLTFAISLLGDPDVLILDEPSVGIDLYSRQSMWEVIRKLSEKRLCLFSTNSMEEGNMLCEQIAIQVAGEWKCLGGLHEFEAKFGGGYQVIADFVLPQEANIAPPAATESADVKHGNGLNGLSEGVPIVAVESGNSVNPPELFKPASPTHAKRREGLKFLFSGAQEEHGVFGDTQPKSPTIVAHKVVSETPCEVVIDNPKSPQTIKSVRSGCSVNAVVASPMNGLANVNDGHNDGASVTFTRKKLPFGMNPQIERLIVLRDRQKKLLDDLEWLGFEIRVLETRGTQVVLQFPTITPESPLAHLSSLIDFFERRTVIDNVNEDRSDINQQRMDYHDAVMEEQKTLKSFQLGQMHLKHIFHKFASQVAI